MSQDEQTPGSFADQIEAELNLGSVPTSEDDVQVYEPADEVDETPTQAMTALPESARTDAENQHNADVASIRAEDFLTAYRAGYKRCLQELQDKLEELDSDDLAGHFFDLERRQLEAAAEVQAATGDVSAFIDAVDAEPDADLQLISGQWQHPPTADDVKMQVLVGDDMQVPATRDSEYKPVEEMDVEKVLREQAAEIERLEQAVLRADEATQVWADASDYFNGKLAGQPEAAMNVPLLERVQTYVQRLEDYDGTLPPSLAGFLTGQPEADTALTPVAQLAMLIQRLQGEAGYTSLT